MIENILEVSFHKSENEKIEFGVFTLEDLFSGREKLTHPLDRPQRVGFYHISRNIRSSPLLGS
jgi:hypothetical protein